MANTKEIQQQLNQNPGGAPSTSPNGGPQTAATPERKIGQAHLDELKEAHAKLQQGNEIPHTAATPETELLNNLPDGSYIPEDKPSEEQKTLNRAYNNKSSYEDIPDSEYTKYLTDEYMPQFNELLYLATGESVNDYPDLAKQVIKQASKKAGSFDEIEKILNDFINVYNKNLSYAKALNADADLIFEKTLKQFFG